MVMCWGRIVVDAAREQNDCSLGAGQALALKWGLKVCSSTREP